MKMTISLAQMALDPYLSKTQDYVEQAKQRNSDIVIFPEMWSLGFNGTYHEEHIHIIQNLAKKHSMWICGSLPSLNEENRLTNALTLFSPTTVAAIYRKVHLFSSFFEAKTISPGHHLVTFDFPCRDGGMISCGFAICYDLRFPEFFRSYALQGVKVIFLVAAFSHPRLKHWEVLVKARAIENQFYMVCVNRVGSEVFPEAGVQTFFGSSMIVNPWGETVLLGDQTEEALLTTTIDLAMIDSIRNSIKVFKDRRPDVYKL